jgi:co-chaperonin GroES (HSP10)
VAIGTGTPSKPMTLKVGQIVFRVKDWGTPIEENGVTYYLMDSSAIIATD